MRKAMWLLAVSSVLASSPCYAETIEEVIKVLGPTKVADDFARCGSFFHVLVNVTPDGLTDKSTKKLADIRNAFWQGSLGILAAYSDLPEKEGKERSSEVMVEYIHHHMNGLSENFDQHYDLWFEICDQYSPIIDWWIAKYLSN